MSKFFITAAGNSMTFFPPCCSPSFDEFLSILGEKVRLKGFDRYKGGLDTVHDLTVLHSVFTHWRSIEIMFHVSTLLPHEAHDPQKVPSSYMISCLCY